MLTDNTPTEVVLKALDHIKASHHTVCSSDTVLYTSQTGQRSAAHQYCPQAPSPSPPTGSLQHGQQCCWPWSGDKSKWCSHHSSYRHSLEECHVVAHLCMQQPTVQAMAFAAMTTAAVAAVAAMPPHSPQASIFTTMTTATTTAHPSNFTIITKLPMWSSFFPINSLMPTLSSLLCHQSTCPQSLTLVLLSTPQTDEICCMILSCWSALLAGTLSVLDMVLCAASPPSMASPVMSSYVM